MTPERSTALNDETHGPTEHVPDKRPASRVAGPYGHPFHAVSVTLPIGAFVASVLFDVAALADWLDPANAAFAAAWLLVIGIVGAMVSVVLGVMDLATIPDNTSAGRTAVVHGMINSVAVLLFGLSAGERFVRYGLDDVSMLGFGLSIAGLLVLFVGGWLGGKLAYTYGVRVAREVDQDAGFRPHTK